MLRTILGGVMLLALVAQAQAQTAVAHVTIDTTKPGPEIFALALRRFGVAPADCLFIDDVAANVAGARAAGLAAVQFTSAAALRRLLLDS